MQKITSKFEKRKGKFNNLILQGASGILKYYEGDLIKALQDVFSDLSFDVTKFLTPSN